MKLETATFEMSDSMDVGEKGNLKGAITYAALECSSASELESSSEDGHEFGSSFASSLKEHGWESRSWRKVTRNPSIPADMNMEVSVPISSAIRRGKMTKTAKCEGLFSSGFDNSDAFNNVGDVEDSGNQVDSAQGSSNETFFLRAIRNSMHHHNKDITTTSEDSTISASSNKALFLQENMDTRSCYSEDFYMASPECSGTDVINAEEASIKALAKTFDYMNRIPKVENGLKKQIKLAGLLVEEKTKLRDAIQIQIQEKRANRQVYGLDYEYARGESQRARNLVKSKRLEIDHLLSVINKAKNALAVEDVDNQINAMEHVIHHETLSLKEEKQLMHKKRQLKLLGEQLTLNLGNEDETKRALERKEDAEKQLRILRKELNILKDTVLKAEAAAVQAGKKYGDENKKLRELQLQLVAVNDDRQVAYSQWQILSKEFWTKNNLSLEYKNDTVLACKCVLSRNTESPHQIDTNQNMNDMFCQEYVKFKGLGTLDGCAFVQKEEQSIRPNYVHARVDRMVFNTAKVDCLSQIPNLELKREAAIENVDSDDKLAEEVTDSDDHEPAVWCCGLLMVSGRNITGQFEELEESKEEAELTTKAEIVSIEDDEVEAKLKEQRQLEEVAKANEARERKKRQENKIQLRKELKARKEAEQKEKEREKRLRKKVQKKATGNNADDTSYSRTSLKSEGTAKTCKGTSTSPVSQKRQQFMKQSKTKSAPVPPPLRNRKKRIYQQWMGLGLTTLVLSIVFCCVNIDICSGANPKSL